MHELFDPEQFKQGLTHYIQADPDKKYPLLHAEHTVAEEHKVHYVGHD